MTCKRRRKTTGGGTLWKWLERAVEQNLVCRDGLGRKKDPYFFWLPGKLDEWEQDPLAKLFGDQLEMLRSKHLLTEE